MEPVCVRLGTLVSVCPARSRPRGCREVCSNNVVSVRQEPKDAVQSGVSCWLVRGVFRGGVTPTPASPETAGASLFQPVAPISWLPLCSGLCVPSCSKGRLLLFSREPVGANDHGCPFIDSPETRPTRPHFHRPPAPHSPCPHRHSPPGLWLFLLCSVFGQGPFSGTFFQPHEGALREGPKARECAGSGGKRLPPVAPAAKYT